MNGPVDVRAVIRAVIEELRADGNTGHVQSLLDADAAVAALIEADKEYDAARALVDSLRDGVSTVGEVVSAEGTLRRAQSRRTTALANIRSAS